MPDKRRYTVRVAPAEAERLRAFDNRGEHRQPWPLGPRRTFRRTRPGRFVVQDFTGPAWDAVLATAGKARLLPDDRVEVEIAVRSSWIGWLLLAGGVLMMALTFREGPGALLVGAFLCGAAILLFLLRPGASEDLDAIEAVMRAEIRGDWQPR